MNEFASSHARAGAIGMSGTTFRDGGGRHVILRGVNLGGDTKVPTAPNGHTYVPSDFTDHRSVSFVGRPAPLAEIDEHLSRLRHWGFNCLRLLTTWEAVEHAGPGEYDDEYLGYFTEVCRRAGKHGLHVFVDFHQDVWSRMSGGSGAPGWTFEVAGLDFTKFGPSGAAHLMQYEYDHRLGGRQEAYPIMSWSGNYARPANGIMWTQFFAGADLAPGSRFDGCRVQDYLQDHYFGSLKAIAERVAHLEHVIGFDTLNEPGPGYIGRALTAKIVRYRGPIWTALDGLAVASGLTRELPVVAPGQGVVRSGRFNEACVSIWLPGREDPFRAAGAWDVVDGDAVSLREDHFQKIGEHQVDLAQDYMAPFFGRVAQTIRAIRPDWLVFAETDPFEAVRHGLPGGCPERTVNANHWYDLTALVTKRFSSKRREHVLTREIQEGPKAIEDAYARELSSLRAAGDNLNGGAPTLLGEFGIQFDLNGAEAYARWAKGERGSGVWQSHIDALTLMYNAIDRNLMSSTHWNYTVSNRNDPMVGDGWNQEDLSIWSVDQAIYPDDPNSGGRAIEGFCRPYVRAAQGTLVSQTFDLASGTFEAKIDVDAALTAPTEIYVPALQYPRGYDCDLSKDCQINEEDQILLIHTGVNGQLVVRLDRR